MTDTLRGKQALREGDRHQRERGHRPRWKGWRPRKRGRAVEMQRKRGDPGCGAETWRGGQSHPERHTEQESRDPGWGVSGPARG